MQTKIDEIRQKPEYIRLRYVWTLTAVSMIFVLIVWVISIKSGQLSSEPAFTDNQKSVFNQLGQDGKSLQNTTQQMRNMMQTPISQDNREPERSN